MFRIASVAAAASLIVLTACAGGDEAAPTAPAAPPPNDATIVSVTVVGHPRLVPETARRVDQTQMLGRIDRRANETPEAVMTRELLDASCQDEIMVIETSEEAVYAALPCGRFWDRDTIEAFSGEEVAIVLEIAETRQRVVIETLAGAQADFIVAGIWVE